MELITDEELRYYILARIKAEKLSVAKLERLSDYFGLRPYLSGQNRSISLENAHKVLDIL